MKSRSVSVVGGGQMGRALVCGMMSAGVVTATDLSLVEPNADSQAWWAEHHGDVRIAKDLADSVVSSDVILLAVKPNVVPVVAAEIDTLGNAAPLVISIAAGVTLSTLCGKLNHHRVARVMPNTPSLVGEGASAYCIGEAVADEDCQWIESAFKGVGSVAKVAEYQMDAVTGLSGSGPAYICMVIEALADGGVLTGLPRPLAMQLATQTVLGTAKMVMETGRHPGELKDAVASPGGTTIAAIQVLEDAGMRAALIGAVEASARRSAELS